MSTIIKSLSFNNFYNFYGSYDDNTYTFTHGVNIINADNGMGKSKIYNGILWLLCNQLYDSDKRAKVSIADSPLKMLSDKAKIEHDSSESGVQIIFEDEQRIYTVIKSISYTKKCHNASTSNSADWSINSPKIAVKEYDKITGNSRPIYELDEQSSIINRIIDPTLQNYALLQGEAIDNIVDLSNSTRLSETIETLTELDELKTINKTTGVFIRNADNELLAKRKLSTKNEAELIGLESRRKDQEKIIKDSAEELEIYKKELAAAKKKKEDLYAQISNTQKRVEFQGQIKQINIDLQKNITQRDELQSGITNRLFNRDKPWLMLGMSNTVSDFSSKRDDYIKQQRDNEIISNPEIFFSKLPAGSPDAISISKMIKEHKCFVCGTNAPEGSKELEHIRNVQNVTSKTSTNVEVKPTIKHFFDEIQMSIQSYTPKFIDSMLADVGSVRKQIKRLEDEIKALKKKKSEVEQEFLNYGGNLNVLGGSTDTNTLSAFERASTQIGDYELNIKQAEVAEENAKRQLKEIENQVKTSCKSVETTDLEHIKEILEDVDIIFTSTKERIYERVISQLQTKTNEYYSKLTEGNNVLGGSIRFERTSHDSIEIEVLNASGATLYGASEGFQRMKKIAVVMAIISSKIGGSKFAYPFIADAPFSAFGQNFRTNFFNATPSVFGQSIILIKDLYDPYSDNGSYLTDEGDDILQRMKNGELSGSFYVNIIDDKADTTGLVTKIKKYQ